MGADEAGAFVGCGDAVDQIEGGVVKPAVVVLVGMFPDQEDRPAHVGRAIEVGVVFLVEALLGVAAQHDQLPLAADLPLRVVDGHLDAGAAGAAALILGGGVLKLGLSFLKLRQTLRLVNISALRTTKSFRLLGKASRGALIGIISFGIAEALEAAGEEDKRRAPGAIKASIANTEERLKFFEGRQKNAKQFLEGSRRLVSEGQRAGLEARPDALKRIRSGIGPIGAEITASRSSEIGRQFLFEKALIDIEQRNREVKKNADIIKQAQIKLEGDRRRLGALGLGDEGEDIGKEITDLEKQLKEDIKPPPIPGLEEEINAPVSTRIVRIDTLNIPLELPESVDRGMILTALTEILRDDLLNADAIEI